MSLNLKTLYNAVGQTFQRELERNVKVDQKGVDGSKFPPIKASTARARASKIGAQGKMARIGNKGIVARTGKVRKSAPTSVPMTRLLFTERFWRGAFRYKAHNDRVEVYVNTAPYPIRAGEKAITYSKIAEYNNGEPSVIFPRNVAEAKQMPAYQQAADRFRESLQSGEISKMFAEQGFKQVAYELNISM
jgi:hypothetical protein